MVKDKVGAAERGGGIRESAWGLILLAVGLFASVVILWFFIDRRESSLFPVPRADQPSLGPSPH